MSLYKVTILKTRNEHLLIIPLPETIVTLYVL